jgi:two-component system, cell cycle sensor histidine kinase DivJ
VTGIVLQLPYWLASGVARDKKTNKWDRPRYMWNAAKNIDLAGIGPDVFSLLRDDGSAVYVGANAERVMGYSDGQISRTGLLDCIHADDRQKVLAAIENCLARGSREKAAFRTVFCNNPGELQKTVWFEISCEHASEVVIPGEDMLVLAIIRDISERKMLEETLREQHIRAESASIAKSRFLANMSHELRTPLNAILGFSELLQSSSMANIPNEKHPEYISLIHTSASHLLDVVNDILDMSKIESGKYEIVTAPFDLAGIVDYCCAMLRGQAEQKNVTITIQDMHELPQVDADQRAIKQILINLVSNAVKFTDTGGRVTVSAHRYGRRVELCVADNGIGISSDHVSSLGKPYYQADNRCDRKYEGTGLGLSVVFGLVELHGGSVDIKSIKGQGTRVVVKLPIVSPETRPVPADEALEVITLKQSRQHRKSGRIGQTLRSAG